MKTCFFRPFSETKKSKVYKGYNTAIAKSQQKTLEENQRLKGKLSKMNNVIVTADCVLIRT